MIDVALVDSGGANIASLQYAFQRLGVAANLTRCADTIRASSHVVLPGVGAAADAMQRLTDAQLPDVIRGLRQPVLGICLGMHLLCEGSEEGNTDCLGVMPGVAQALHRSTDCPVPNMGWCPVAASESQAPLGQIDASAHFYFLHSYALPISDNTIATAKHHREFSAIARHRNFVATQFHPERSSAMGKQLLQNFLDMTA